MFAPQKGTRYLTVGALTDILTVSNGGFSDRRPHTENCMNTPNVVYSYIAFLHLSLHTNMFRLKKLKVQVPINVLAYIFVKMSALPLPVQINHQNRLSDVLKPQY